jgi:hypothetical protein
MYNSPVYSYKLSGKYLQITCTFVQNYKVNFHFSDNETGKKITIWCSGEYGIFFICCLLSLE